ncbi:unnamed protein product [Rodentolepis nana]|uniref:SH3 domain-containing protein n=1 Tax=Rodentolepis nana TaxID=102285 RepID=A0A0R3TSF0_RODNA|nr:unnamed protein product [Rodentolepis nana]
MPTPVPEETVNTTLEIIQMVNDTTCYARNLTTEELGLVPVGNITLVEGLPRGSSTNSDTTPQSVRDSTISNSSRTDESVDLEPKDELLGQSPEFKNALNEKLKQVDIHPHPRPHGTFWNFRFRPLPLNALNSPPDIPLRPEVRANLIPPKAEKTNPMTMDMTNVWLKIHSLPEMETSVNPSYKVITPDKIKNNGDVVQWLDYNPAYLSNTAASLEPGKLVECLQWNGESIVLPSSCVRLLTSVEEIAEAMTKRPRAQVLNNFTASTKDELSVKAGEIIYLMKQLDSDSYMAINKSNKRGRVPSDVLNILLAPG